MSGPDESAALARERRALGACATACTWSPGAREERLRFDYQKTLAERLGFADDEETLGVEKMMQGFYRSAAIVRRISDRLLQRFEEQFDGEALPEPLDEAFALRRGYLAARDPAWPQADVVRGVRACSRRGRRIRKCAACIRAPRARWPSR